MYYTPASCGLASFIAAYAANVNIECETVNIYASPHVTKSGVDFSTINPQNNVPTVVLDNGAVLNEGAATLQYIADLNPGSVAPAPGSIERYTTINDLNYIGTELHKGAFALMFNPKTKDEGALKDYAWWRFDQNLKYLNDVRLKDAVYLSGDKATIADFYLYVVLGWCPYFGGDLSKYPVAAAYHARIHALPEVQGALERVKSEPTTTI